MKYMSWSWADYLEAPVHIIDAILAAMQEENDKVENN